MELYYIALKLARRHTLRIRFVIMQINEKART